MLMILNQKVAREVVGKEGEDLTRHDKWLCMMYPRLMLLRKLLAENGTIFISIDDTECANLRLICDEIFGIRNFLADVIWEKSDSPRMMQNCFPRATIIQLHTQKI
jgi:adenine-specific DNA-methyltransferase